MVLSIKAALQMIEVSVQSLPVQLNGTILSQAKLTKVGAGNLVAAVTFSGSIIASYDSGRNTLMFLFRQSVKCALGTLGESPVI
jgi:hypothetical protein